MTIILTFNRTPMPTIGYREVRELQKGKTVCISEANKKQFSALLNIDFQMHFETTHSAHTFFVVVLLLLVLSLAAFSASRKNVTRLKTRYDQKIFC